MAWKTLLLDNGYQPLQVIDWMKAVELLLSGKAEIVEEYEDIPIRSAYLSLKLPSVLRLINPFTRRKRRQAKFSRYNVFYRDNWMCQYCGNKFRSDKLTFDHVIPRSKRTPEAITSWENIATCCYKCNHKKGGRTPEEAGMKLIKKPVKPEWTPQLTLRLKGNEPEIWLNYIYWHSELVKG